MRRQEEGSPVLDFQNRYRAKLTIVAEAGKWKIADLSLLDEERLR